MKKFLILWLCLFSCVFAGCALTDQMGLTVQTPVYDIVTGEVQVSEDGSPVTKRELAPEVKDAGSAVGEIIVSEAKSSGGILGIIATALCGVVAIWKGRKSQSNLASAASLARVIEEIMNSTLEMKKLGIPWNPTKEQIKEISRRVLEASGTHKDVQKLLEKLGLSSGGKVG